MSAMLYYRRIILPRETKIIHRPSNKKHLLVSFCCFVRLALGGFLPSQNFIIGRIHFHDTSVRYFLPFPRCHLSKDGANTQVEEFGRGRDARWRERSKRWIIIVDDEEPIRRAVGQYLFEQGYQVTACADAATALTVVKKKRVVEPNNELQTPELPDVIVSDIRMPGIDGIEFLRMIRADPQLVGIPVVLLTAKGMAQDRIEGYKAGADAYIPKPFDPEELLTILDKSIDRHDALNGDRVGIDDLQRDLDEIKYLLLEKGGGGIGNGWVEQTNVFLTPDERDVLELLCKGLTNKEIAEKTYHSTRRVEQLVTSMFRKTELKNRTELVRWAVRTGNVMI